MLTNHGGLVFFFVSFPSSPAATCRLAEGAAGWFSAYVRAHVSRGETESERGKQRGRKLTVNTTTIHLSPASPLCSKRLSSHFYPPHFLHITRSSIYQVQPEQRGRPHTLQARHSAVAFFSCFSLPTSLLRILSRRRLVLLAVYADVRPTCSSCRTSMASMRSISGRAKTAKKKEGASSGAAASATVFSPLSLLLLPSL